MSDDDRMYYEARAEAELVLAQSATSAEAVRIHCQLADAYLDKLALADMDQPLASIGRTPAMSASYLNS